MKVYQPAEDSYFLAEVVGKHLENKDIKVLDLGTGSGIQSKNLIELGVREENILAVDLNLKALEIVEDLGVQVRESNLFSNIKEKFDLIIFNPPYLPKDLHDKEIDTTGGDMGDEIIVRFIKGLKEHLTENGRVFLLTSSFTPDNWREVAEEEGFNVEKLNTKKLFFEELWIWEIKSPQQSL